MKFIDKITPLIIGGTVSGAVSLSLLFVGLEPYSAKATAVKLAQALPPEEVNLRAKQIIVRIDGASVGSGSIIERSNDEYTVLSNWHVMKNQGDFVVQTIDGRKHQVISSSIKKLPGVDLAIFKFSTDQNYQTAELGDSGNLSEGQNVYFAGYPGELRREDNRYYRFFTANLVGILPKSTENGYSLIYNGEAFPGMSGGPVFNRDGLMIGVHGEANVAFTGGTSNYAIPINAYQQAIAQLDTQLAADPATPAQNTEPEQPAIENPDESEAEAKQPDAESTAPEVADSQEPKPEESLDSARISSVPTFAPATSPETNQNAAPETEEQQIAKPEPEPQPATTESNTSSEQPEAEESEVAETAEPETEAETVSAKQPEEPSEVATKPEPEKVESEEIEVRTTTRKIALVSPETGIDYTELRNLLKEKKWSEADIQTYRLIEQVIKSAKQQNQHVFIELKTIAEYSCPDLRTVDYLWKKYSGDKFGFSPQQKIWQNVNQKGDFSTQTWRRFATEVGWKKGEVASGSGYLLYDQLDFEPAEAPPGHLPWWFALPDEEQKVIKYLFARCNLNPTDRELEAEAKKNSNTAQNSGEENGNGRGNNNQNNNQSDVNKPPKSPVEK